MRIITDSLSDDGQTTKRRSIGARNKPVHIHTTLARSRRRENRKKNDDDDDDQIIVEYWIEGVCVL